MSNIFNWSRRMLWAVCIASFAVTLWVRFDLVARHVQDIGSAEDNMMHGFQRILLGQPLYGDPEAPPFPIIQYAPLQYYSVALIAKVLGFGAYDVQPIYMISRVFCLLCDLVACWVLFRICRKLKMPPLAGFGAVVLLFTWLHELYWSRPDSPFLLFFLLHVEAMLSLLGDPSRASTWKRVAWPAFTGAMCLFAKQSGLEIPLIDAVVLVMARQWRTLFHSAAQFYAWGIVFCIIIQLESGLPNAYKNLVLGNANGTDYAMFMDSWKSPFFLVGAGWTIAALVCARWLPRQEQPMISRYLFFGSLIALAWALITGSKRGSNANYFLEHYVFCWLVCGFALSSIDRAAITVRILAALLGTTVALRALLFWWGLMHHDYRPDDPVAYNEAKELRGQLIAHGLKQGDWIWFTRDCFGEQFLAEHVLLQERIIYMLCGSDLPLDHSEFERMLARGDVRYVIKRPPKLFFVNDDTPPATFTERFRVGAYTVYEFTGATAH